jgi:hypothetical protein
MRFQFHPAADAEFDRAIEYYERCQSGLGLEFDSIDKANGILAFFQNRHSGMDLDAVMNDLILYDREDQRVPGDIAATVATMSMLEGNMNWLKIPRFLVKSGVLCFER